MTRALFVDRDGVVNDLVFYPSHGEWESPRHVDDLRMRPGAADALREARQAGWELFLLTNQPSFAKGKCPLEDLQAVHQRVVDVLQSEGVVLTESFVCYHHPESRIEGFGACECRKPSPFFILEAAAKYELDVAASWMAGDQDTDIETGRRAGCRTALIEYEHSQSKRGSSRPDIACADLAELVRYINR
jgi:D-glycero-D-manno-heptose 1,7-bisphosphate phosphatase